MATTNFGFTGITQTFTVTTTGEYNLQAIAGAGGATQNGNSVTQTGGRGAEVGAIVNLTAGEVIEVIVGGQGGNSTNFDGAGGGGGTFILANTGPGGAFVPLLVAGGGGGGGYVSSSSAAAGRNGNGGDGSAAAGGLPGVGGGGGGTDGGGGGTGSQTVGTAGGTAGGGAGTMYAGGTAGGSGNLGAGAFGGGGGGGYNGGGGGGGDSGGQGGQGDFGFATGGAGASSFFASGDITVASETLSGANAGNGSASLTQVSPTVTLTSTPSTGPDNSVFTITGTANYGAGLPLAAGTTVTFSDNGTTVGTTTTAADGTFSGSVTLPTIGANNVTASVTDTNGATGTSTAATYNLFKAVRDLDATSQSVDRTFYTLLNRAADATTLAHDDTLLAHHRTSLKSIASSLIKSREYRQLNGHQSNSQFVEALYEGAFGRPVDAGALAIDVHQLAHGLSRQGLATNLAQSPEAVTHLGAKPA